VQRLWLVVTSSANGYLQVRVILTVTPPDNRVQSQGVLALGVFYYVRAQLLYNDMPLARLLI